MPLLTALSRHSTSPSRDLRNTAIGNLQRLLFSQQIIASADDPTLVDEYFNRVVFPLLDEMLKKEVFQRDPQGMPLTRIRATDLLCKVFLRLAINQPSQQPNEVGLLWIQILDLLDRLMNIDKRDQLVSP